MREGNGLWSVFVIDPANNPAEETPGLSESRVTRKIVEVIQLDEDRVLIEGKIADGDFVIANGVDRVVPGQTVEPRVADEQVNVIETAETDE